MTYLGVDPGLSGAIAAWTPATKALTVYDAPTFAVKRNGKDRRELDVVQFAGRVNEIVTCLVIRRCVIEAVSAMPKQGVASAFTFGLVTGQMIGVVSAFQIPLSRVPAAVWKRAYGLDASKDSARRLASSLLPAHAHNWPLAKHDGRAEAALLALYAAKLDAADSARRLASSLLPQHDYNWPLVKHDGRAEAALLALYAKLDAAKMLT